MLLHGWPQHWWCWRKLIPPLAKRYRVICPDLRGHGWTEAPDRGYDKEQFATDLFGVLDALELDRVRLVGHDWGGFTGFLACLRQPERFERYLALNIAPPWGSSDPRVFLDAWRFAYQLPLVAPLLGPRLVRWFPGLVSSGLKQAATQPDTFTDEDVRIFAERFREPARAAATAKTYRAFQLRDLPRVLAGRYRSARLRTPTLLLFGEQDGVLTGRMLRGSEEQADDMRIEHVPEAGHFIAEDCPALVTERALSFFA